MRPAACVLTLGLTVAATPVAACTLCHSPTALGVRRLLLEHDPLRSAAALAAPFPLLLAGILLAARPPRRRKP
jgi:hypothetical protein